jgi:hypothetical protein
MIKIRVIIYWYWGSGGDEGDGSLSAVLLLVGKARGSSVVAGESVDSGFDQDESVLGILVLAALFEMASDVDSLLDHAVDVFGNLRSASCIGQ